MPDETRCVKCGGRGTIARCRRGKWMKLPCPACSEGDAAPAPQPCCGTRHGEQEGCPPERHCDSPPESAAPAPPPPRCEYCGQTPSAGWVKHTERECPVLAESAAPAPDTEIQNHSVRESAAPAAGEDTVHALGFYTTVRQRISAREMLTIDDACRFAAAYARSRCAELERERDKLLVSRDAYHDECNATAIQYTDLKERAEKLRAALLRWQEFAPNCAQLLDGWHQDGTTWSEWDETVRRELSEVASATRKALEDSPHE